MTDEVCMIYKTAYASQHGESFRTARTPHKVTCAGCTCEPGEACDSLKKCGDCCYSKTLCDAQQSANQPPCCRFCDHRAP